ncbi:MAG: hypothetical protein GXO22_00015 [Aquificae bacterium]|nr:hypothetical protein [Aquificota bacterium]
MEEKKFNIKGIAVDILTDEWLEEDIINKTPITIKKIQKRPGGFTIYMDAPFEKIEWYFSKGLTTVKIIKGKKAPYIRIEHEDGIYWVDIPYNKEITDYLKEYIK